MGELLAFRAQPRVSRRDMPRAEGAEILFFTGIRYVRMEDYVEDRKAHNHRPEDKRLPAKRCEPSQH
jgi:hypothetical protein